MAASPPLFNVWRRAILDHLLTIELRQASDHQPLAHHRHRLIVLIDRHSSLPFGSWGW